MSFGRSRARMSGEGQVHVNFSDVAGEDEAKEELAEVVDFLKNPGRYTAIGAKILKGFFSWGLPAPERLSWRKRWPGSKGSFLFHFRV